MGFAENSSVLTFLFFVIRNLKNLCCENLLASWKLYLLFILCQSKAGIQKLIFHNAWQYIQNVNKRNDDKRFNNRAYSLFYLTAIFLKHLSLIPNILKWQDCKIFAKLVPLQTLSRSSHRRCSVKKGVLKNLRNFTGKHLCWSLFLIKSTIITKLSILDVAAAPVDL